jgi:hypothetical protein
MILPDDATPSRMEFSESTTDFRLSALLSREEEAGETEMI